MTYFCTSVASVFFSSCLLPSLGLLVRTSRSLVCVASSRLGLRDPGLRHVLPLSFFLSTLFIPSMR